VVIPIITDGFGLKPFIDQLYADMTKIGEIHQAELRGDPIDIEEARAIIGRVDTLVEMSDKLPGPAKIMVKAMRLKSIQRDAHKHLALLEEKAKTQGVVTKLPEPKPEEIKAPSINDAPE